MKEKVKKITLNELEFEKEKLFKELQFKIMEVYYMSGKARLSREKSDFEAYVSASAQYEDKYNQLVKVEEQIRLLRLKSLK